MAQLDDDIDETLLEKPCRFCLELYPEIVLLDHQAICEALIERVSYGADLGRRTIDAAAQRNEADLNAAQNDDDVDELLVEIACRICGELFPTLVMAEHQAICELLYLSAEEALRATEHLERKNSNSSDAEAPKIEQKDIVKTQNTSDSKAEISTETKVEETNKAKAEKINIVEEIKVEPVKASDLMQKAGQSSQSSNKDEENKNSTLTTAKTEKNIFMSLGTEAKLPTNFENEEQSSPKRLSNPLFEYADQTDDKGEINNLSDDDCEENLEDYWKRARESLKHKRLQNV